MKRRALFAGIGGLIGIRSAPWDQPKGVFYYATQHDGSKKLTQMICRGSVRVSEAGLDRLALELGIAKTKKGTAS